MNLIKTYWKTLLWNVAVLYLSFTPKSTFSPKMELFQHQDKVVHMIMYFGIIFWFLYDSRKIKEFFFKQYLVIGSIAISYSILIEVLQPILSNRSQDFFDVVFNSIGCCLALFYFGLKRKS